MNYYIIFGIALTILGSFSTGFGYYKQMQEEKAKDIELNSYREESLKNQVEILEKSDLTYQETVIINGEVEKVNETTSEILEKTEKQFEIANKPVLTIKDVKLTPDRKKYVLFVKNSGKSMAENIQLHVDYSTPAGKGVTVKWDELPAGENSNIQLDILHMYGQIQHITELKQKYDEQINDFKKHGKGFIVKLKLEYNWGNKTYTSKEYFIMYSLDELMLI